MQKTLEGLMRRKQGGNEQRWVASRISLPHIITLDYPLQRRLDAVGCSQPRMKAFRGNIEFGFSPANLAIYIPDNLRSDTGHACMTFQVWSPVWVQIIHQQGCRGSFKTQHQKVSGQLESKVNPLPPSLFRRSSYILSWLIFLPTQDKVHNKKRKKHFWRRVGNLNGIIISTVFTDKEIRVGGLFEKVSVEFFSLSLSLLKEQCSVKSQESQKTKGGDI